MDRGKTNNLSIVWTSYRLYIRCGTPLRCSSQHNHGQWIQFYSQEVKDGCANMGMKHDYASVYHPWTNGQVEWANGLIMSGIKPRLIRSLKESSCHWVEELDSVLWGLRTTPNRSTEYTPFFMVYGAEAVLLCDLIHDAPRVRMYGERKRS